MDSEDYTTTPHIFSVGDNRYVLIPNPQGVPQLEIRNKDEIPEHTLYFHAPYCVMDHERNEDWKTIRKEISGRNLAALLDPLQERVDSMKTRPYNMIRDTMNFLAGNGHLERRDKGQKTFAFRE